MNFIRNNITLFLSLICLLLVVVSCKKEDHNEVDNESQSVADASLVSQEWNAVASAVCYASLDTKKLSPFVLLRNGCDSLRLDSVRNLRKWYSLPVSGCNFTDGKVRSGILIVTTSSDSLVKADFLVVKLRNYMAEGIAYSCDSLVLVAQSVEKSHSQFDLKINGGKSIVNGATIRFSVSGGLHVFGAGTEPAANQGSALTGSIIGINRGGLKFSGVISEPGIKKFRNCSYISEGFAELTPEGFKSRTIDFGDGSCDDLASFKVNENSVAFKLK